MKKNNKGFTLVEMIIVVSIFAILLGILAPSLNSVLGFRVQRAANSIGAALDKTKTEAMNRLVGVMELERRADGYYISYHLDRGKISGVVEDQPEKIAPRGTIISYKSQNGTETEMSVGENLLITYDREDGSFRPLQTQILTEEEIQGYLANHRDIVFYDDARGYCEEIIVKGGFRTRIIELNQPTGTYTINAA